MQKMSTGYSIRHFSNKKYSILNIRDDKKGGKMQIYNIVYKNRTNEIIELKCTDFTLEEYKKYIVNEKGDILSITQKYYSKYKLYQNKEYKKIRKKYLLGEISKEQYQEQKNKIELLLGSRRLV